MPDAWMVKVFPVPVRLWVWFVAVGAILGDLLEKHSPGGVLTLAMLGGEP